MSTAKNTNGKPLDLVKDGLTTFRETLLGRRETVNIVDAVESVGTELHRIAVAINDSGAGDGGAKWEMVRHHGECIKAAGESIADAIRDLADAIRESQSS